MKNINLIAFIKRGKNRRKVFEALDKPMMPSELVTKIYGKSSNTYFNIISRALAELKSKGLVRVENPKEKTGRMYRLSDLGHKLKNKEY